MQKWRLAKRSDGNSAWRLPNPILSKYVVRNPDQLATALLRRDGPEAKLRVDRVERLAHSPDCAWGQLWNKLVHIFPSELSFLLIPGTRCA